MTAYRVLFAGELGAGLGHIMPLWRIAEALRIKAEAGGRRIVRVFAVHDPDLMQSIKRDEDIVLQAPRTGGRSDIRSHTASYAEILISGGFADLASLRSGVATWDDLFRLAQPDLLVADHSPKAVLAARERVPALIAGNGFTVPPAAMETYPALISGMAAPAIQSVIRDNVNALLSERGTQPVSRLPEFLKGEARAIFTLPPLDPYGRLRDTPLAGLYEEGVVPTGLPETDRIFLYGHASVESFSELARATLATGLPISAYLAGNNRELAFLLRQRGAEIFETPPKLADILPRTSLVVSNGGAGLSHAALAAGRPQVILPIHVESQMTARNLQRAGCAHLIENASEKELDAILLAAPGDREMKQTAQKTAHELARQVPQNPLEGIAETCLSLLEG